MDRDSLGDRMKGNYEDRNRYCLIRRMPVIIRLDGRAFHSIHMEKPFDEVFNNAMIDTAKMLCSEVQGAKCAYTQSDEISILLTDFDELETQAWFGYNIQKIVSISAALCSSYFNLITGKKGEVFDSRAFNIPKEEVANYFIWRQKDWVRNSVLMLSQAHFSHKQLNCKKQSDMHEMLHSVGINWDNLENKWKNGIFVFKGTGWEASEDTIFTKDRFAIERYLMLNNEIKN